MAQEIGALSEAFGAATAKLDDQAEGVELLLESMVDSVTRAELAELERRLEERWEAKIGGRLEAIQAGHRLQLESAAAAAEGEAKQLAAYRESAAARLDALEARLGQLEAGSAEVQRVRDKLQKVEGELDTTAGIVSALRSTAERGEALLEARMEEELQSFARSFGQAASRVDGVVQSLDRKLQSTGRHQTFGIPPERELKSRAGPLLM